MARKRTNKRTVQVTKKGYAYIQVSFNNTIVTITNMEGQTVAWSSAGKIGFKGSKKNTPYAATEAVRNCAEKAYKEGVREVVVYIKGLGAPREAAIRGLGGGGILVTMIRDKTPIPFNGVRAPKKTNP